MTSIAFTGDISFRKYMKESWRKEDLLDEQVTQFLHTADLFRTGECSRLL